MAIKEANILNFSHHSSNDCTYNGMWSPRRQQYIFYNHILWSPVFQPSISKYLIPPSLDFTNTLLPLISLSQCQILGSVLQTPFLVSSSLWLGSAVCNRYLTNNSGLNKIVYFSSIRNLKGEYPSRYGRFMVQWSCQSFVFSYHSAIFSTWLTFSRPSCADPRWLLELLA